LMTAYKNSGYDAAAITDHDTITADPVVAGITHIPGC
jgi:predicted metal-dependent phosphoesterase TrpH